MHVAQFKMFYFGHRGSNILYACLADAWLNLRTLPDLFAGHRGLPACFSVITLSIRWAHRETTGALLALRHTVETLATH